MAKNVYHAHFQTNYDDDDDDDDVQWFNAHL